MRKWCSFHGYYIFPDKLKRKCCVDIRKPCPHLRNEFISRVSTRWLDVIEPTPFDKR